MFSESFLKFFSDFEIRNICVTIYVFIRVVHGFQDFFYGILLEFARVAH